MSEQKQEPVQIALQDIATVVQMIDVVSRRGAFEGNEMAGVGMLRNKLEVFLRQNAPQGEAPEGQMPSPEAPANVPADAPMANKVKNQAATQYERRGLSFSNKPTLILYYEGDYMSIDAKANEVLWVEKYRPQKIDDTILPEKTKAAFKKFVEDESIPNLLLTGGPGVGKTLSLIRI